MKLYEIDAAIESLVDYETGEILDIDAFESLQMKRELKLEGMALWYKNLCSEAAAIREEEKRLAERRKACESNADGLKTYLAEMLAGQKIKTPRVTVSWRKSTAVEFEDEADFIARAMAFGDYSYLTVRMPEVSRKAVTDAIKQGVEIEGAALVERHNIQIK